ncbi:MAG: hypothetical protein NTW25_15270 [Candidatus Kapabacteria bacterium]|nr:hypothetical protein [Candidatus Kapabacteria bacterium]
MNFKNIVLIILLILLSAINTKAQFSISSRLGVEIDKSEKEYFGLFPSIKNYFSAKSKILTDNKVEIVITRNENGALSDTSLIISSKLANYLASYIEGFELFRNKEREVNWKALEGLAKQSIVLDYEVKVFPTIIIVDFSGKMIQGQLMNSNDSSIIIVPNAGLYNWTYSQNAIKIKISYISSLIIEKKSGFWQGAKTGALIGGGTFAFMSSIFASAITGSLSNSLLVVGGEAIAGGIIGGLVGGVIGSLTSSTSLESIKGQEDLLMYLKEHSAFSIFPPPELVKLVNK